MADPYFGITLRSIDEEARPAIAADLSTIGIIGPATGALASAFPLNEPVLVHSNDISKIALLGEGGYIADALRGINDQLGETQFAARCVIVRVAEGVDADPVIKNQKTINNIVGSSTAGTGIFAFLKSPHTLGFTPRIIVAPGFTGQMANGAGNITKTADGANYVPDAVYTLTFSGGGANAVQATAHAIGQQNGTLGPAILDTPGAWYTSAPTIAAEAPGKRVTASAVAVGGTGYAADDTIALPNGVVLSVTTVGGGGAITAVAIEEAGFLRVGAANPTNPVGQVETSGAGTGATFNLTWTAFTTLATYSTTISLGANPICASLTSVLNQLLAHAIVESVGSSQTDDDNWRETLSSQRLIPLSGGCRILDPVSGLVVTRPLAPRMAGVLVRRDHEKGAPFHSAANQPVQGIIAPARDISFALTDDANEAQELLLHNIGVVVRGEIGNDFAIASGGFVLLALANAGEDELWRFYNMTRGRDFILLTAMRAERYYLGRYNITLHTVVAMVNTLKAILRDLHADGHILGSKVSFNPQGNSVEKLRSGHLTISFAAEEPAPLRLLTIEHSRYRPAVDALISDLATQLNLQAAA